MFKKYSIVFDVLTPAATVMIIIAGEAGAVRESFAKMYLKKAGVEKLIEKDIMYRHKPDKMTILVLTERGERIYRALKEIYSALSGEYEST